MRVPTTEHLGRFCLSEQYRQCELYRRFLGTLAETPERWRSRSEVTGGSPPRGTRRRDERTYRKPTPTSRLGDVGT